MTDEKALEDFDEMPGEEYETHSKPWEKTQRERAFEEVDRGISDLRQKIDRLAGTPSLSDHFTVALGMLGAARSILAKRVEEERASGELAGE